MTQLSSYKNGSSSSSAGSSKNHNCYHTKCPQYKALRAISSSCSSSYNFLAKFQKSWYREIKEYKDYGKCDYKHARTATSATNRLETLDIPHFSAVAVPKNSATSSATTATKKSIRREENNMNQIRVMGMMDAESEITKQSSPSDFGDDLYDGVSLYRRKDMKPVVLFVSKNAEPARWKVLDGASEFYFRSYTEATNFCRIRGYIFMKGGKQREVD